MNAKREMKIIVVEPRGGGGMIHYAYQMCTAMAKEGADVTLVTSIYYELENLPHNFKVNKLMKLWPQIDPLLYRTPRTVFEKMWRKIFWNLRRGVRAVQLIQEWIRLTSYLLKSSADIIQVGSLETTIEILFLLYWHQKGITLSQICHEFEERDANKNLIIMIDDKISQYLYKVFSVIFLHGETNKKKFLASFDIPHQNVYSIEHGNEQIFQKGIRADFLYQKLREKYRLSKNSVVALFFGNLTPSKGISDLIRAFEYVNSYNKNAKLIIAGAASKYVNTNDYIDLIKELNLTEVAVLDNRYIPMEEIEPLMQLADVVVFPYRTISQSGALQVAYTFGKPVVATNVGGFPDAVDVGKSGFLVPVEAPKELAEAILRILENPEMAKEMGRYAKHLSETKFAWEPIARKILGVYFDLIKSRDP